MEKNRVPDHQALSQISLWLIIQNNKFENYHYSMMLELSIANIHD